MRLLLFIPLLLFISCKKDKVPEPEPPPEPSKWELIAGHYKVYDTTGVYLYEMDVVHVPAENPYNADSLRFENFDGAFTFTEQQSTALNVHDLYVKIGNHGPLFDSNSKRWKILVNYDSVYDNIWYNDTIRMRFDKTNINYYITDLVPYYSCECKQIAVKQ